MHISNPRQLQVSSKWSASPYPTFPSPWRQCLWKSLSRTSFSWQLFLMLPLSPTFSQRHFLLTRFVLDISFCWHVFLLAFPSFAIPFSWLVTSSPFTTLPLGVSFLCQLLFFSLLSRHRHTCSGTLAQQCDCAENWIAKHKKTRGSAQDTRHKSPCHSSSATQIWRDNPALANQTWHKSCAADIRTRLETDEPSSFSRKADTRFLGGKKHTGLTFKSVVQAWSESSQPPYSHLFSVLLNSSKLFSALLKPSRLFSIFLTSSWLFSPLFPLLLFSSLLNRVQRFSSLLTSPFLRCLPLFSTLLNSFGLLSALLNTSS